MIVSDCLRRGTRILEPWGSAARFFPFGLRGNVGARFFASGVEKPQVCSVQFDQGRTVCVVELLSPLDSKVWKEADDMLRAHDFVWDRGAKKWVAPNTAIAEQMAQQTKSRIEEILANTGLSTRDSGTNQEDFETWAKQEQQSNASYIRRHADPGKAQEIANALDQERPQADKLPVSADRESNQDQKLKSFLDGISEEMSKLLPTHVDPVRFQRLMLEALQKRDNLFSLDVASIRKSVLTAAMLGLEPHSALNQCYFVPIAGQLQFFVGYHGLIDLCLRTGKILFLSAKCVYREDRFRILRKGEIVKYNYQNSTFRVGEHDSIEHIPHPNIEERGEITMVYAMCILKGGQQQAIVLPFSRLTKMRGVATRIKDPSSPWFHWREEMILKTTVKCLIRGISLAPERSES